MAEPTKAQNKSHQLALKIKGWKIPIFAKKPKEGGTPASPNKNTDKIKASKGWLLNRDFRSFNSI